MGRRPWVSSLCGAMYQKKTRGVNPPGSLWQVTGLFTSDGRNRFPRPADHPLHIQLCARNTDPSTTRTSHKIKHLRPGECARGYFPLGDLLRDEPQGSAADRCPVPCAGDLDNAVDAAEAVVAFPLRVNHTNDDPDLVASSDRRPDCQPSAPLFGSVGLIGGSYRLLRGLSQLLPPSFGDYCNESSRRGPSSAHAASSGTRPEPTTGHPPSTTSTGKLAPNTLCSSALTFSASPRKRPHTPALLHGTPTWQ